MLLLFLVISQASYSKSSFNQLQDYNLKCFDISDGLPQNSITDLAIHNDGQLIIAGYSGVVVFDGYRFSDFIPGTTQHFPAIEAFSLDVGADGEIWIGATSSGLYKVNKDQIDHWDVNDGLKSHLVWKIQVSDKGVYLNNNREVLYLESVNPNAEFQVLEQLDSLFLQVLQDVNNHIVQKHNKTYYSKEGKVYVIEEGQTKTLINEFITNGTVIIRDLLVDSKENVWVATSSNGLFKYSEIGLEQFNQLPNNRLSSIIEDEDGTFWVGTSGGLCNLTLGAIKNIGLEKGLFNENIFSVELGLNDEIYAIPYGQTTKLQSINSDQIIIKDLNSPQNDKGVIIKSIAKDINQLWVLTQTSISKLNNNTLDPIINLSSPANELYIDDDGLWYQQGNDLVNYIDGKYSKFKFTDRKNPVIKSMSKALNGDLLIAESLNVYRFNKSDFKELDLNVTSASCIHEFVENEIWVCDNGLWLKTLNSNYYFNEKNKLTKVINGHVHDVISDQFGNIWAITNSGLFRIFREDLESYIKGGSTPKFVKFSEINGIKNSEFNSSSSGAVKTTDGMLWFASQGGVVKVDPELSLFKSNKKLTPFIEHLYIGGDLIADEQWARVAPTTKTPHLHFGTVFLSEAKNLQYRYKMPPELNEWKFGNSADFSALDPDTYELKVQVRYHQNQWSEPLVKKLVLLPAWYQTIWFKIFSILTALVLLIGVPYWRIIRLNHNKKELKKLVNEKTESLTIANAKLEKLSKSDELTSIYNRREFINKIEELCQNQNADVCLALIDIDDFKSYNDYYGHLPGDDCLIKVANILNKVNSESVLVARFGGEEFVILFDGATLYEAHNQLLMIYNELEMAAIPHKESTVKSIITLSAGLVERYPNEKSESLINRADIAMYKAKSNGKNKIILAS